MHERLIWFDSLVDACLSRLPAVNSQPSEVLPVKSLADPPSVA